MEASELADSRVPKRKGVVGIQKATRDLCMPTGDIYRFKSWEGRVGRMSHEGV